MASSSGNSTTTTETTAAAAATTSQLHQTDERKRKRMQSNRESARRSRMRKQKHLDDLTSQFSDLRRDNERILSALNLKTQQYLNMETENSVLRAQLAELTHRLDSLDKIMSYLSCYSGAGVLQDAGVDLLGFVDGRLRNCWNLGCVNTPIVASTDYNHFRS